MPIRCVLFDFDGVIADTGFILICSYSRDGSDPEIVVFKRR